MADDEEMELSIALAGEIEVGLTTGGKVQLTRVEALFGGTFGRPDGPLRLTVGGKLGELRKLGAESKPIRALLPAAAHEPEGADAELALRTTGRKMGALRRAALGTPENDAEALLRNEVWLVELLTFKGYSADSLSVFGPAT